MYAYNRYMRRWGAWVVEIWTRDDGRYMGARWRRYDNGELVEIRSRTRPS